ncbi:uncharacterized protein ISCGN_023209 [Ixodes scapularis]
MPTAIQVCIKPPSRTRTVQTEVSGTLLWASSPLHSSDPWDLDSSGEQQRQDADPDYSPSEDSFEKPEKQAPSLVEERKFIVFESCLDVLLDTCQTCAACTIHMDKSVQGCCFQVSTICKNGHVDNWCSQPIIRRKPVGNILMAASALFTGCCIKKTLRMLTGMGIACFTYRTFFTIQKAFLLPAIEKGTLRLKPNMQKAPCHCPSRALSTYWPETSGPRNYPS